MKRWEIAKILKSKTRIKTKKSTTKNLECNEKDFGMIRHLVRCNCVQFKLLNLWSRFVWRIVSKPILITESSLLFWRLFKILPSDTKYSLKLIYLRRYLSQSVIYITLIVLGAIVLICSMVVNRGDQTHRHTPFLLLQILAINQKWRRVKFMLFENKLSQLFTETQRNIYYKGHL